MPAFDSTVLATNAVMRGIINGLSPDERRLYYALLWIKAAGTVGTNQGFNTTPPNFGVADSSHWLGRREDYSVGEVAAMSLHYHPTFTSIAAIRNFLAPSMKGVNQVDALESATATAKAWFWQSLATQGTLPKTGNGF